MTRAGMTTKGVAKFCRWLLLAAALPLLSAGCGGADQMPTAAVSGSVTHDGKPVPGGTILFLPIASESQKDPGKGASGVVKDGAYTLSTYSEGDGAIIGKHRVVYSAPQVEQASAASPEGGHNAQPEKSPYEGMTADPAEVEVTASTDKIDIKLIKP